jgi:hypothetical protein
MKPDGFWTAAFWPWLFLAGSLIAGGFLIYTLWHLEQLGLPWYHPRVLVEAGLMIGFGILSLSFFMRS